MYYEERIRLKRVSFVIKLKYQVFGNLVRDMFVFLVFYKGKVELQGVL